MRRLLLLLLVLPLLASAPAAPAVAADGERSWRGLDVPYLSAGKVHFRGSSFLLADDPDLPVDLVTLAATRQAAILQPEEGLLLALPAGRGRVVELTRRAVGIPIADPPATGCSGRRRATGAERGWSATTRGGGWCGEARPSAATCG